jgi:hypothetical protein
VRSEKVEYKVKADSNILHKIRRRQTNWIGHILRRSCLLQHFIDGKRRGREKM